jgi:hypothetical protein
MAVCVWLLLPLVLGKETAGTTGDTILVLDLILIIIIVFVFLFDLFVSFLNKQRKQRLHSKKTISIIIKYLFLSPCRHCIAYALTAVIISLFLAYSTLSQYISKGRLLAVVVVLVAYIVIYIILGVVLTWRCACYADNYQAQEKECLQDLKDEKNSISGTPHF